MNAMMETELHNYFELEYFFSWIKLSIGLLAIVAAIHAWRNWGGFGKGLSLPLMSVGLIQVAVAGYIVWRTGPQLTELSGLLTQDPTKFIGIEQPRMSNVVENFVTFRYAQFTMLVVGLALLAFGRWRKMTFVIGLGSGFSIFGPILLLSDTLANNRALKYFDAIERFIQ